MLTCGKLLVRVGATHVKELNIGLRNASTKTFCAASANASIPTGDSSTAPQTPKNKTTQKVDVSCCGFAKDLVGARSTVLDNTVFGEDACFIARFKSTHVAG
jgi:hypothetical protein